MKKLTIVTIMVIVCSLLNGQPKKDIYGPWTIYYKMSGLKTRTIGDELQIFTKHYYAGFGISILGAGLIYAGVDRNSVKDPNKGKPLMIAGGIVSGIGFLISLESNIHIGRAGILLNENGIGIKIPIPNK
jgi:hypothetical protein